MKKIYILFILLFNFIGFAQEQTLYWIGGAGNWDDLSHWSFQSGSQDPNTQPSSIPNAQTNVIFDENSGLTGVDAERTVTIRLASYNIKSLTFTNGITQSTAPIINKAGDYSITLSGNVILQSYVKLNLNLNLEPIANTTSTITMNGIGTTGLVYSITKNGAGISTVNESLMNTDIIINEGTLKLLGSEHVGGNMILNNNSVLEMLAITYLELRDLITRESAYLNLANCTEINIVNTFSPQSTNSINFPFLQNLYARLISGGSIFSVLNFPNNSIIETTDFIFEGELEYTSASFIITNGSFVTKSDNHIHSITIKNPVGTICRFGGAIEIDKLVIEYANTLFVSNINIGEVTFASSSINTFESSITITESLVANSAICTPYIEFKGNTNGTSIMNNSSGSALIMNNAIISNFKAEGAQPINVIGIDNGGNSGSFVFSEPSETTLYWVGDANDGEWHNIDNWAQTSGGQGGYCLPNRYSNVIFDGNSVMVNGNLKVTNNPAVFHNMMILDNAPIFEINGIGNNSNLSCYGSWTMRSEINVNLDTYFLSNDVLETITSNTSSFAKVFINGAATWVLQDALSMTKDLHFRAGTLDTNDKDVYIGGFFNGVQAMPIGSPERSLILRSSQISLLDSWWYNTQSLLDAGTSHIIFRNGGQMSVLSTHEYYDITVNTASDTSVQRFNFFGTINAHDVLIKTKEVGLRGSYTNSLRVMPNILQAYLYTEAVLTTNVLELQKNALMEVGSNLTVTVNNQVITHTNDCEGLMEIYVRGKAWDQKFIFKSLNNVHIPNVWMTGVEADLSTGASYTATGDEEGLTQNWIFSISPIKDLYWIGTVDDNWNNGLNWTTNSNGTPSIDGCVPDHNDNVHFNSFSFAPNQQTSINIRNAEAYLGDFIVHNDFEGSLTIHSTTNNYMEAFGNLFQLKDNVLIDVKVNHNGDGIINILGGETTPAKVKELWLFGNSSNQTWNVSNLFDVVTNLQIQTYGVFNANQPVFNVNKLIVVDAIFNSSNVLNASGIDFYKGEFNAENKIINISGNFASLTSEVRLLNIKNSTISNRARWIYSGNNGTLLAEGSKILSGEEFTSSSGHHYNIIETTLFGYLYDINGDFSVNDLIIGHTRKITGNLNIKNLTLLPKNLTLSLAENTTQTITNNMMLNGTPCQFNTIEGLGSGANIAYANPNDNNTFDFVQVSGINATDANINFQVNSSNLGNNNNKVVFIQGATGVIGLGPDQTCKDSFYVLAYGFYGGPLSEYVWYKKDENGNFINLNLPLDTLEINAFYYGLDGEYRVDMVYDATLPENLQCKQSDSVHITFAPMNVGFVNNPATFCENELVTIADILITQETLDFMDEFNSEILWFANATDSTPLATTTILVDGTTYYATLLDDNGCYSNDRMPVLVEFSEKPIANAGQDQIDPNQTQFTMQANNPAIGVGTWSVVSGDVSIADVNSYNTTVTLLSGESATLRWTVDNNGCTSSDVVIIGKSISGNHVPRVNPSLRSRVF